MQRSLLKRLGYNATQALARLTATSLCRMRVVGRQHIPKTGGGLVCANHQSFLDPILVGLAVDRRMNFLARDTLFQNSLLKRVMEFFDTIPIDREGSGMQGLKETLRRLKREELVLIFPEGTRTRDGELLRFKPGFCAVARRSQQPLIPIGCEGAFQAWPRTSPWPRPTTIAIAIGEPISPAAAADLSDAALVAELRGRVAACCDIARRLRR